MARKTTNSISQAERLRRRAANRVTLIVIVAFTLVGIAGFLATRAGGRDALERSQTDVVQLIGEHVDEWWTPAEEDARFLAANTALRAFAETTIRGTNDAVNSELSQAQDAVVQLFATTMERNRGRYLAIRYVTANNYVWSEVTNYDNRSLQLMRDARIDELLNNDLVRQGLGTALNETTVSQVLFRTLPGSAQAMEPVTPFIRIGVPVSPSTNMMTAVGVVQIDLAASIPLSVIPDLIASGSVEGIAERRISLIDQDGHLLADTAFTSEAVLGRLAVGDGIALSTELPVVASFVAETTPVRAALEQGYMISTWPVAVTGPNGRPWSVVLADNLGTALDSATVAAVIVLGGALGLGGLVNLLLRNILFGSLRPLETASEAARQITNQSVEAPPATLAPAREANDILQAFVHLQNEISQISQTLDERTEHYQRNLEIAARISRETANLRDVDVLLERTINLICTEFGFYHAQVFLADDAGLNAVLYYSPGEAGTALIAQGHKLAIGSQSVIGQVTARGEAVIVNDTQAIDGAPHQFNPLLADTRAEMALPLVAGGKVIGALDIQSEEPDTFRADELQIFQLLADQIAIAIVNARLFVESEARVRQIAYLNRQFTQNAWQSTFERGEVHNAYRYDLMNVTPDEGASDQPGFSAPIAIRGVVIGQLSAQAGQGTPLTEDDQALIRAVADRVGLAIENARLLGETQASLLETYALYQLSRTLGEANNLEDILRAIITTVTPEAVGGYVGIFTERVETDSLSQIEIAAVWTKSRTLDVTGTRLRREDHPFLLALQPSQVVIVEDISRDQRIDPVLVTLLHDTLRAQSMVVIPINVRGLWRGILMIGFPDVREFDERDGRLFTALIDQAGVAIDNRMLLSQNEVALAQIERLYGGSRVVNMARSAQDVVRAAVVANNDLSMGFELALLEGDLDETGWPMTMRVVARTQGVEVVATDDIYPLTISSQSQIRQREPLAISLGSQAEGSSDFAQYMLRNRYQFGICFPLFSANQPIALFIVVSEETVQLSAEDHEIYRALTGQMSTVLQNRRLLEQTAQALDESRRLYEASRAIANAQDAEAVLVAAAQHLGSSNDRIHRIAVLLGNTSSAATVTHFDCAYVWARDAAANSDIRAGMRVPSEFVPFGNLIARQEKIIAYNRVAEQLPALGLDGFLGLLNQRGSASALVVSLQSQQKWLGVMLLESAEANAFPNQFVPFVQAVSDQLGTAIGSLQSFEEAQAQARRALALAEAGQLANQIGEDLAVGLEAVFSRVAQAADYNVWQLMTVNEDETRLEEVIRAPGTAHSAAFAPAYDLDTDRHLLLDAYRSGKAITVNDPNSYPGLAHLEPSARQTAGKLIAVPVLLGVEKLGVLILGRRITDPDLNERDEQLATTLASQVAVALENRRLLRASENEKERLRSVLETLPAGVIVLEPHTMRPLQANEQAEALMGRKIDSDMVFGVQSFSLYRTGTSVLYPSSELPIFTALASGQSQFSDDVTVRRPDNTEIDLLVNAAPIVDERGQVTAIIAAFQDITTLRSLENTLQENLRETITLYETTRSLAETVEVDEVLDLLIGQIAMQDPLDIYILLLDQDSAGIRLMRSLNGISDDFPLPDSLLDPVAATYIGNVRERGNGLDEAARLALLQQRVGALISMPMRARFRRDAPLGWIVVTYASPQNFTLEREQSLNTLIESAAVTLDNRYLFRSTQLALDTTASLYKATTEISGVQTLEELSNSLNSSFAWLSPDIYAAYLRVAGHLTALCSVALDDSEIDFGTLLDHHQITRNIFIDDVRTLEAPNALEQDIQALGNVRALGIVPLRLQGRPSGYLVVAYHQARKFTESESHYLDAVADSASVVTDNILLLDQIQSSLQETSILYMASRDLNDAVTEQDILNVVINHLLDRPVSRVLMLSHSGQTDNPSANVLYVTASWNSLGMEGLDLQGVSLSDDQFPAWRVLASSDLTLVDDVVSDPRLNDLERLSLTSLELRSLSILPLRAGERVFGSIVLGHDEPYAHSDRDNRVYRSFAEQASLRLEASRLFAQTERRARQLATSARVSQLASSLEELDRLLPTIVELIKDAFGYDHAQIFLMDEANRYAVLAASTGEAGQQLLARNHRLEKGSQSVIGRVTATGEPTLALDTADSRVVHRPNPLLPNTRSEIAIPLQLKGRVVGALDVQSNMPNFFNEEDVTVLTTLAAQISVAIDNAQLYEQSQARAKDMYFLFTVATAAAGAETLSETMQNVTVALQELLEAASVTMYLPVILSDGEQTLTELRPVALAGADMPLSEISEVRLDETDNLLSLVASELRPQIIPDIDEQRAYVPIVPAAQSAVVVPLAVGSSLVSVITLESMQKDAYNDDTLTLLLTLSGTLSAIVQSQQLLEELQRTNEQLLELDRLKSDFLANMSHELRTPLNSIIGFSRVILKGIDGPLTEMQEQDLTTIYNSGQHLLNLINDILDQAKIAAGKMDLQADYFDIKPVIDSARSIGIGLVKDKPIDIVVHFAPGLPKAYGDEFRTRQVLLNLVSNAAKFTREGSITINVYTVNDDASGRPMIGVDVTDTGIGIAEKDLPLLFEAFRQVDSSLTKMHSGTGLGLPIAKSLIEMQNGRMEVQSQVNVGSTFSIYLPMQPANKPARSTQELSAVQANPTRSGSTKPLEYETLPAELRESIAQMDKATSPVSQDTEKQPVMTGIPSRPMPAKRQILLIEDNPDMVDQFRRTLQRDGFDVYTATIPLEAEAMASGLHPTLVVLDTAFAEGAGWTILERLKRREDTNDIPILVVGLGEEGERAAQAGAFCFIRKPFMPEILSQAAKDAEKDAQLNRILIIDDEPDSARLLQELLDEAGRYRVFRAENGSEGVSMVARRRPDLVILDLRMPEMDGFRVIEELRGNPETATIPIMVVTGDTLNQQEIVQLSELKVIYKPDLDTGGSRRFADVVKSQLERTNGESRA